MWLVKNTNHGEEFEHFNYLPRSTFAGENPVRKGKRHCCHSIFGEDQQRRTPATAET